MEPAKSILRIAAAGILLSGAMLHASEVSGVVTNRTDGKPAAGETVTLVDPQATMRELDHVSTDARGRYKLNLPSDGAYLVRVIHQGASYFIAAPQSGASGDIPVYDVATKLDGVSLEADILEIETENGQLHVIERYFVHNTSSPPRTQWSPRTFEVILPPEAMIASAAAQRPNSISTSVELDRNGAKGHYSFNFPIQPDEGDKDTLFQVEYLLPYTGNSYTFHTDVSVPAQSIGVLLPKSMKFQAAPGGIFPSVPADPTVQTFVARNAVPGKELVFTVSGSGTMPQETQADKGGQSDAIPDSQPGGGIGEPIGTPDPLTKYKAWILGGLLLLLAAAAAFLLRKSSGAASETSAAQPAALGSPDGASTATLVAQKAAHLRTLKEELFALESRKLFGTIEPEEYTERKAAIEMLLGQTLTRIEG